MPELPEVETLRRSLVEPLVGRRIMAIRVYNRHLRFPVESGKLRRALLQRRIEAVGRRAKYLLLQVEDAPDLVVHLGMSGSLYMSKPGQARAKHTHIVIGLSGGRELRYQDPRRFGMMFLVDPALREQHPRFRHLGPEPLESGFDAAHLLLRARGLQKPIKNFLMDAAVVVGVGNIYASEALYRARVAPTVAAGSLRQARWQRVTDAIRETLQGALQAGGTTLQDFRDGAGDPGWFQTRLAVYGRAGEPCHHCSRRIRRIVQAGRSTFYCPACQR